MKILLLRSSAIGDVIHTFPAIGLIKKELPSSRLFTIVQEKVAPLMRNQPLFEKIWELPDHYLYPKNWSKTLATIHSVRTMKFDAIIDFHALLKSVIFFATARGTKFGFNAKGRGNWTSFFADHKTNEPSRHVVEQNFALAADAVKLFKPSTIIPSVEEALIGFPYFHTPLAQEAVTHWLEKNNLKNIVVLTPNTAWPSKHWPLEHYQTLITLWSKSILCHRNPLVLLGAEHGGQGKALAQWIKKNNLPIAIAPNWDLETVACLINKAELVIAPDTGIAHLADFLGKTLITLFGPTAPEAHGPRMREKNRKLVLQAPCPHFYERTHGTTNCMALITPETLMALSLKTLNLFAS